MNVYTGKKGRPAAVDTYTGPMPEPAPRTATFAPYLDRIAAAEARLTEAVEAHEAEPTQQRTVELYEAQLRVHSLRAQLARLCNDAKTAKDASDLAVKFAKSRDDAVGKLWGDELDQIHAAVTRVGGVHAAIAAELAAELGDDDGDASEPSEEATP